jgi:hypothetical protein
MIRRIAVITPVKHLLGIADLLETKGKVFYLEQGNKDEAILINKTIL